VPLAQLRIRTATAIALLWTCQGASATDFLVEISGARGVRVGGTCLLVGPDKTASYTPSGIVPLRLQFSGELISCAIQRKAGAGTLKISIKAASGRVVDESSLGQPFGILFAGGR